MRRALGLALLSFGVSVAPAAAKDLCFEDSSFGQLILKKAKLPTKPLTAVPVVGFFLGGDGIYGTLYHDGIRKLAFSAGSCSANVTLDDGDAHYACIGASFDTTWTAIDCDELVL